jgi:hypothetical protein
MALSYTLGGPAGLWPGRVTENRWSCQIIGHYLEDKLEALEWQTEIRTEILKPVFTNVCVSDEFIRMYNATVDNTERTLSGKPEAKMPNGKSSAH